MSLATLQDFDDTSDKKLSCLTNLYMLIRFTSYIYDPTIEDVEPYERRLLKPTDALVRHYGPKLQVCQIAANESLYGVLQDRTKQSDA